MFTKRKRLETLLWISIAILAYTYLGYPLLLWIASGIRRLFHKRATHIDEEHTPTITIVVAAYNEIGCIDRKIENTLQLSYPSDRIRYLFVTDGSNDGTPERIAHHPKIHLLHEAQRSGKINAIQRAMKNVDAEIVLFTDANTMLNTDALLHIVPHYRNARTGGVAGEKRVWVPDRADSMAGEGMYWRYESFLKKQESATGGIAGAAGELFSMRTSLYRPVPPDTILDDLVISMQLARSGYRVHYESRACATEMASPSVHEERKRKQRITAGDMQALLRIPLFALLFEQPLLCFKYTSHRILRWIMAPYLLVIAFVVNAWMVLENDLHSIATILFLLQSIFYIAAITGACFRAQRTKYALWFIPFYFCLMNANLVAGTFRYLFKGQSVNWSKAERKIQE